MPTADEFLSQYDPPQTADSFLAQYDPEKSPGYAEDVVKAGGASLAKGIVNAYADPMGFMASFPRALAQGVTRPLAAGYEALAEKTGLPELSLPVATALTYPLGGNPDSQQEQVKSAIVNHLVPSLVEKHTGMDMNYQPQTTPGKYSASVGSSLPYMAQGLPFVNAVGMGIGSQAGQDAAGILTDNPKYQQAGSVIGGVLGVTTAPETANAIKDQFAQQGAYNGPRQTIWGNQSSDPNALAQLKLSTQDLHDLASGLFKKASIDGQDVVLPAESADTFINKINKISPQTERVRALQGQTEATKLIDGLQAWKGRPIGFNEANELDQLITKKLTLPGARNPITGDLTAEGNDLKDIQDSLRETVHEVPDDPAFATQNLARKTWSAYLRQHQVDQIIDNAELSDNPANALKSGFKSLAKKLNKNSAGWSDEEINDVKSAAKSGVIGGAFRFASSRIIPLLATIGGGGVEGGGGGIVVNEAAKSVLNKIQMNRANAVSQTISNNPDVQSAYRLANTPSEPNISGFSMIPTPPQLASPPKMLSLPAPEPDMVPSNQPYTSPTNVSDRPYSGQMRPQTPEERDRAIAARQNPDVIAAQAARADQTPDSVLNTELRQKQKVIDEITAWRKAAKALSERGYTYKEIINKIGKKPLPPSS